MASRPRMVAPDWAVLRRWPAALAVLALMLPLIIAAGHGKGVYWTRVDVVFLPPPGAAAGNPLRSDSQDVVQFAAVIQRRAIAKGAEPNVDLNGASLFATGIREGYRVYQPNAGSQWQQSFNRAVVSIEVVSEDEATAAQRAMQLADSITLSAGQEQKALGVIPTARISTELSPSVPTISYHGTNNPAAMVALTVLASTLAAGVACAIDRAKLKVRNKPAGKRFTVDV